MKVKLTIPPERIARERDEKRRAEYPALSDFADALYWREKGDPKPLAAYVARVDAVKAKFPKA